MTVLFEHCHSHRHHAGAALVVALTLVAATTLLATATLRDATLDAAMTSYMAAHSGTRLAAVSALESILADPRLSGSRDFRHDLVFGHQGRYRAIVTARYLGRSTVDSGSQYFELTAEVSGPRNSRHRRRLYYRIPPKIEASIQ